MFTKSEGLFMLVGQDSEHASLHPSLNFPHNLDYYLYPKKEKNLSSHSTHSTMLDLKLMN